MHSIKNFSDTLKFLFYYVYDYIYVKNKPIPPDYRLYYSYILSMVQCYWILTLIYINLRHTVMKYSTHENLEIMKSIILRALEQAV